MAWLAPCITAFLWSPADRRKSRAAKSIGCGLRHIEVGKCRAFTDQKWNAIADDAPTTNHTFTAGWRWWQRRRWSPHDVAVGFG